MCLCYQLECLRNREWKKKDSEIARTVVTISKIAFVQRSKSELAVMTMTHFHGAGFIRIAVVANTACLSRQNAILSVMVFFTHSLLRYTCEISIATQKMEIEF